VDTESMPSEAKATSFVELYGAYARDVYRFALYLSGDSALAQDITSETFLRVWLAKDPVRAGSVKAWLLCDRPQSLPPRVATPAPEDTARSGDAGGRFGLSDS
jgi:RNA polymerase sigma-70 factor (ECF subfamily)